jgi:hypothetical protein
VKANSTIVKRSISLSKIVSGWADELAAKKGFGSNFSAYMADLVRRDRDREIESELRNVSFLKKKQAADAIVDLVQETARNNLSPKR